MFLKFPSFLFFGFPRFGNYDFVIYVYIHLSHITVSSTVTDDLINYATHRISNTNL